MLSIVEAKLFQALAKSRVHIKRAYIDSISTRQYASEQLPEYIELPCERPSLMRADACGSGTLGRSLRGIVSQSCVLFEEGRSKASDPFRRS